MDTPADQTTTVVIPFDGGKTGFYTDVFETPGDADWAKVVLPGGSLYFFSSDQPALLSLVNASGDLLAVGDTALSYTTPSGKADYYLGVTYLDGRSSLDVPYTVSVRAETAAGTGTLEAFNDGKAVTRTDQDFTLTDVFETAGDEDWVKVVMASGYNYAFSSDAPLTMELMDASGNLSIVAAKTGKLEYNANVGGVYFLRLADIEGSSPLNVPYTVTLKAAQIQGDTPASAATTKYIYLNSGNGGVSGSYTDKFDFKNDADWAAVSLTAGTAYSFTANNQYVAMELLQATTSGAVPVTSNALWQFDYTPKSSGLFYLAASNWQNRVSLNSSYTITIASS